ncbi:MAG: DUF4386 family protein, partial [Actinomycetota bacterium]|nr:DUF4386 family protein [Actinomycetota bacterium]
MAAGGSTRAPAEQLEWEARLAPYAAAAAAGAVALFLASVYPTLAFGGQARRASAQLLPIDAHPTEFLVGAVLGGLSTLALGAVLAYLYSAARYRRPELPTAALALTLGGAALAAVSAVVVQAQIIDVAHDFAASRVRTEARADDLLRDGVSQTAVALGFAGNLALGFGIFLISLNAMRAGLLSRLMGVLGIVVGVLYVIPQLRGPEVLQLFWLGALAALFLGRWPGGRGRAWEAGEAIPWPTAAEQRAALERRQEEAEERGADGG